MASLEYVTAGLLRLRRLTGPRWRRAGAVEACAPGLCPVREGDWGSGTFCRLARSGRRGGGRPWLHPGGSSPVYLVPLCSVCFMLDGSSRQSLAPLRRGQSQSWRSLGAYWT